MFDMKTNEAKIARDLERQENMEKEISYIQVKHLVNLELASRYLQQRAVYRVPESARPVDFLKLACRSALRPFYYPPARQRVEVAPGFRCARFLGHFVSKRFREMVFEPMHADMVADYLHHLHIGDYQRARWIRRMMLPHMLHALLRGLISKTVDLISRRQSSAVE